MDDFNVNRNDVNIMCKGTEKIFTQVDNLFPSFRIDRMNNFPYYKELYTTPINNLKVCLHFSYIDYFIVNDQGVCIGQVYDNYKDAVKAADEWDLNYKIWLDEHTLKGLPKTQLKKDILEGNLMGKLVYAIHKGKILDECFHNLSVEQSPERIIIHRPDGMATSIFYFKEIKAAQLAYTGDKLNVFMAGYRLCNEEEQRVMKEWEEMRDYESERIDALTDCSVQYWRKKHFYEEQGCKHLLIQRWKGLVCDNNVRGILQLSYEIKKK